MEKTAAFTIDPGFIVQRARDHVLSADWRGGLSFLLEGMEGMTLDIAVGVLKGELTLVKEDDGMSEVPADKEDPLLRKYLELAAWQTAGIYTHRGEFYQPYAQVQEFGTEDADWAEEEMRREEDRLYTLTEYRDFRGRYYARQRDSDLVLFGLMPSKAVLLERIQGPAFWVKTFRDARQALEDFLRHRELLPRAGESAGDGIKPESWRFYETPLRMGQLYCGQSRDDVVDSAGMAKLRALSELQEELADARMAEASRPSLPKGEEPSEDAHSKKPSYFTVRPKRTTVEDAERAFELAMMREAILEQAEQSGGFLELLVKDVRKGEYLLKVPAAPLLHWSIRNVPKVGTQQLPNWQCVCFSGMKMLGDNPLHTDWWVGAGLDPEAAYVMDHPVNEAAWRFATSLAYRQGYDCVKLAGSGIVFGQVVFPAPNESVPEGSIVVVPNAGVDYELAMLSACKNGRGAVISSVGGKLAHLATVAREMNARIIVVDNATAVFKLGEFVTLDLDQLKVSRHETLLTCTEA